MQIDLERQDSNLSDFQKSKLKTQKILVFFLTAFLYSTLHASRTAWAYSKPSIAKDLSLGDTALSILDTSFLCAYAIGLYLSGWLGDRIKLKTLLGRGLLATVFALGLFSLVLGYLEVPNLLLGAMAFLVSGLGQSTGFPGCVAILSNWFSSGEKGLVFGAWLVNVNIGNIIGQQIGRITLDSLGLEWFYTIIISTALMFFATLMMLQFLHAHPSDINTESKSKGGNFLKRVWKKLIHSKETSAKNLLQESSPLAKETIPIPSGIGFLEALMAPGVLLYSFVFICVKSALYGLLFWLPLYLKSDVGFLDETAGLLALLELGQLLGNIGLGYISDKINNRAWIITISLLCAVCTFYGISFLHSPDQKPLFQCLLFLSGLFIGPPGGMIVSTVSSELGGEKGDGAKKKKVNSTATITGIIDGSGTIGAAITQLIIPYFRHDTFIFYTIVCLMAAILTPFAHRQILKARTVNKELKDGYEQVEFVKTQPSSKVLL